MQTYTVESARAALALGPVRAVCNHCGARHVLAPDAPCSQQAMDCVYKRIAYGVWDAYRPHDILLHELHTHLLRVDQARLWRLVASCRIAPPGACDGLYRGAWYAFACLQKVFVNVVTITNSYYTDMIQSLPRSCLLCPDRLESRWTILPPVDQACAEIARICLGWICDEVLWDKAYRELLDVEVDDATMASYQKARAIRDAIARTAPALQAGMVGRAAENGVGVEIKQASPSSCSD